MKKLSFVFWLLVQATWTQAQSAADAAVQINAVVQNNPPQITLRWTGNGTTTQYQVFRKMKTGISWGSPLATLNGTTVTYTDNSVQLGDNYEYRVVRIASNYSGHGYINAGVEVPETEYRGKLILIVDSSMMTGIAAEIERYISDVEGDGWEVIRHDVLRTATVKHVKDLILSDFTKDTTELKAVFLLGHVPVPYSGNINPDGHSDHLGAWPADVYYGDLDGSWTDLAVYSTTASPPRTQNIPGDGKFDQSLVPGDVELQVGRADFANMPTFTVTEQQMLKNYLDKDHAYRKKIYVPLRQAVIDDNFGYFSGEAFAASGYKSIAPLVGTSSITAADYFGTMSVTSCQWSFGCGGGYYQGASGIGTSSNFAANNLQGVFTMLFGSYFGDWDSQDNFLRAPLAQGKFLTNVWSGRPHYQFHHMGLGENIGYSLLVTQNNPGGVYFASPTGITGKWIHNALMGDPTLRNDVVAPNSSIVATKVGNDCHISWTASTEPNILGYHLYVKNDSNTRYVKLNALPLSGTTYTDYCLVNKGTYSYMVRTIVLQVNNSGSYYNMSEGIADTAYNSSNMQVSSSFSSLLSGATVSLTNTSVNATACNWDFGDGATSTLTNPAHTYTSNGTFTIRLISQNACAQDTVYDNVVISEVGLPDHEGNLDFVMYPNPAYSQVKVVGVRPGSSVRIYDNKGALVLQTISARDNVLEISVLPAGIYQVQVKDGARLAQGRLMKLE